MKITSLMSMQSALAILTRLVGIVPEDLGM